MRSIQIPSPSKSPEKKRKKKKKGKPKILPFLCATEQMNQNIVKQKRKLQYQQDSCVYN